MIGMTTWIMTEMFISHGREKKIELLLVYCEHCRNIRANSQQRNSPNYNCKHAAHSLRNALNPLNAELTLSVRISVLHPAECAAWNG